MDGSGKVRGLLDIAKCLYDAVHRMEKQAIKQEEEDEGSGDNAAVLGAMVEAAKAMKAKGKTAAKHHKAIQVTSLTVLCVRFWVTYRTTATTCGVVVIQLAAFSWCWQILLDDNHDLSELHANLFDLFPGMCNRN